jgi:hypothetical protein
MLPAINDIDAHVRTREAWHTVAERVLAPARYAATGRIGLRAAPGGFATPACAGTTMAVDGTTLVVTAAAGTAREPLTTLGAAAALVGVAPGADTGVYDATTPADPDALLTVDPGAAATLATWFAFGHDVLTRWHDAHAAESPSEIQLWPEHFDLATDLGPDDTRRANYGVSPGDAGHPLPYVYVGPWQPDDDPFWNAGSYARLGYPDLVAAPDPTARALAFLAAGHDLLTRRGRGLDSRTDKT